MSYSKPPKRSPIVWHSSMATTVLELTAEKHNAEYDLWELEGGKTWYDLTPEEQAQQCAELAREEHINELAKLTAARYLNRVYPVQVHNRDLMWDLFFAGLETPESKAIRKDLISELEDERAKAETRARRLLEARAAGVVVTPALSVEVTA